MSDFEEKILERMRGLEREVERLRVKERPTYTGIYLPIDGKAADSDKLDGIDSTGFVNTTATQTIGGAKTFSTLPTLPTATPTTNQAVRKGYADGAYLGISAKAADSDKLDGLDSTSFLLDNGWQSYTPAWTAATTNPSIGNGTLSGRYVQIGKLVYCQFTMRAGSTTTFGSGVWRFSYPVAPKDSYANLYQVGSVYAYDAESAHYTGITQYAGATYMSLIVNGAWVSATSPFTWTNGDVLEVNVIYEAA